MKHNQVKEIWIKHRKQETVIEFIKIAMNGNGARTKSYYIETITRSSLRRIETLVQTAHTTRFFLGQCFQVQHYIFFPWRK